MECNCLTLHFSGCKLNQQVFYALVIQFSLHNLIMDKISCPTDFWFVLSLCIYDSFSFYLFCSLCYFFALGELVKHFFQVQIFEWCSTCFPFDLVFLYVIAFHFIVLYFVILTSAWIRTNEYLGTIKLSMSHSLSFFIIAQL